MTDDEVDEVVAVLLAVARRRGLTSPDSQPGRGDRRRSPGLGSGWVEALPRARQRPGRRPGARTGVVHRRGADPERRRLRRARHRPGVLRRLRRHRRHGHDPHDRALRRRRPRARCGRRCGRRVALRIAGGFAVGLATAGLIAVLPVPVSPRHRPAGRAHRHRQRGHRARVRGAAVDRPGAAPRRTLLVVERSLFVAIGLAVDPSRLRTGRPCSSSTSITNVLSALVSGAGRLGQPARVVRDSWLDGRLRSPLHRRRLRPRPPRSSDHAAAGGAVRQRRPPSASTRSPSARSRR